VRLEYYRLQKIAEGPISLKAGTAKPLDGPSEVGSGMLRETPVYLSKLIDVINERFGTDFTDADQLFFDQIVDAALNDDSLREAAHANPQEKFALVFTRVLEGLFVERMEQNEDIFARFMNDRAFQDAVGTWLTTQVYERLKAAKAESTIES
jgi:type I restriction enzyme R subunit